jgi:amino acid transporter
MLLGLIGTLFLTNTLAQFSKHLSSSAGFGTYAARGLGPRYGFFTSWVALFYGFLFPAEVVILMSQYLQNLVDPIIHVNIPWQIWVAGQIGIIWFFAYTGIKRSARFGIVAGSIEFAIFSILAILLIVRAGSHNTLVVFTPGSFGAGGLAWGLVWAFLSFTGFESVASLAEETNNPKRNIGRSAFWAVVVVGIFYVVLAYAGVIGWGLNKLTGAGADKMANDIFAYGTLAKHIWGPFAVLIFLAVLNSTIACSLAALNFASRYFYSLGRLHILPSALGQVHPTYRTPAFSVNVMTIITLALAEILGSWWGTTITFGFLATAFTFGWILMFAAANIALPFYYRKERPQEFSTLRHIVLPAIGTLFLLPAFWGPLSPNAAPGWQIVSTVPLTALWAVIGIVIAWRMSPARAAQVAHIGDDHDPATRAAYNVEAEMPPGTARPGFAR